MVAIASKFDWHNKLYIRDPVLRRSMFDSLHRFLTVIQTLSSCERSRSQRSAVSRCCGDSAHSTKVVKSAQIFSSAMLICNDIHISITMDFKRFE